MCRFLIHRGAILLVVLYSGVAMACDGGRMTADIKWCLHDANNDGWGDMVTGACKKDASKLHDGFWSCQHDGDIRGNYDSCPAGQQIDTARAVGQQLSVFQPGACGF